MRNVLSLCVLLFVSSAPAWGNYGPELSRADAATDVLACQEAHFSENDRVVIAMKNRHPSAAVPVLGAALREWQDTPTTSPLYPARAFCLHELVPNRLIRQEKLRAGSRGSTQPESLITAFGEIGIEYFYYDPSAEWTLRSDPVDLNELAEKHLSSRWGREAFLMMTKLGWSQGSCLEGPDQFREVIKHSEVFLRRYPRSEVSDRVRLELANAYATWWNLSRDEPIPDAEPPFSPEPYRAGAGAAKEKAIKLYEQFLEAHKSPSTFTKVSERLQKLKHDPDGSKTYDYYCPEYED